MSIDANYEYFSSLSAMLPRIINQEYSEQSVSLKYQHNPSEKKKRKMKMGSSDGTLENDKEDNPKVKKQKVVSVEKMPSLDISELKARLNIKIEHAKITRKHSIEKVQRLKEKRNLKEKCKKSKILNIPPVKTDKSSLTDSTQISTTKSSESLQFSKFESKTKSEIDLESSKLFKKGKKKDLSKMLDEAKKKKKEKIVLQKSTDEKSVNSLQEKAWKKALSMAKGEKQKDNPDLIVKSIKRKEQDKKKSHKEWNVRVGGQKTLQKRNQKKRQSNLEKRIQGKKQKR